MISVPAVEKERYYSVQLIDGNTYNFGYIGSARHGERAGRLSGGRPRLEGRDAHRDQARSSDRRRRSRSRLSAPSSSIPTTCRTSRRCRPATRRSRFPPSSSSPAPPAAPKIDFVPATTAGIKDNFFEYLDAALQFVPETPKDKAIRAKLARIGIGPGKTFEFKDLSLEHKAEILRGHEGRVTTRSTNGWPAETRTSTAGTSARSLATRPSTTAIG